MTIFSEFHVECNGNSPMNRNDPQQVENFGPASLKKDVNKSIAEFSFVFAQCVLFSGLLPESDEDSESVTRKPNRRISFILRPRDKFI